MARIEYYVSPNGAQWQVKGPAGIIGYYRTQGDAIEQARTLAHINQRNGFNAQVHVQRPNGRFRTEWTYGDDPPQYPG